MAGLKELLAEFDKTKVAGISFGGQMHGLVTLDENDHVIRPAILWNDGRTGAETEYLNIVIGKEKLSEYTANIAFAGFTAPKILWMQKQEPELWKKTAKIMLPKDYLAYQFSGSFCTDYSDASGMLLLDVKNKCWSEEMLKICGIRKDQVAKIYESYECVGTLKPEVAALLKLPENMSTIFFVAMTALSLVFYVPVNLLTKRLGKKKLVLLAFMIFACCFGYTALMGSALKIPAAAQGFILVAVAAFPMAIFGILPQAMVADISESDAKKTGENREGMFYAARTFAFKLGQSVSMLLFTALATIGTNGMGYRIVAVASSALALIGGCILISYNEKKIDQVIAETE